MAKNSWDEAVPSRMLVRRTKAGYAGGNVYLPLKAIRAVWGPNPPVERMGTRIIGWGKRTILVRLVELEPTPPIERSPVSYCSCNHSRGAHRDTGSHKVKPRPKGNCRYCACVRFTLRLEELTEEDRNEPESNSG